MLAIIEELPQNPEEWLRWSWHHRLSHDQIRAAIATQKKVNLNDYFIDPISQQDILGFLQNNQQLHVDMSSVLKLQSVDLLDVDFNDTRQREAWIAIHYETHYQAEQALQI